MDRPGHVVKLPTHLMDNELTDFLDDGDMDLASTLGTSAVLSRRGRMVASVIASVVPWDTQMVYELGGISYRVQAQALIRRAELTAPPEYGDTLTLKSGDRFIVTAIEAAPWSTLYRLTLAK